MVCPVFKEKISSYLDGLLGPEEMAEVEGHLNSCDRCREYYNDLSRSVRMVRGLEDIEPPHWLKQRVMAGIREEAERKKRSWKNLFQPLRVKIPVGAVAMLVVAVITIYIFRAVEPDVRVAEAPYDKAERAGIPETVKPPDSEKAGPAQEKPAEKPKGHAPAPVAAPSADETALPVPLVKDIEPLPRAAAPAVRSEVSGADRTADGPERRNLPERPAEQGAGQPVRQKAGKADESVPYTPAKAPVMTDSATVITEQDRMGDGQAVARPELGKAAEMSKEERSLVIIVKDITMGTEEVRKAVRTLGGTVIREESLGNRKILILGIPFPQYGALFEKLRDIGEMGAVTPEHAGAAGQVRIRVEIIGKDVHSSSK